MRNGYEKNTINFSSHVSSYIFLEVQKAKASVDQVEYKTAENIDFDTDEKIVKITIMNHCFRKIFL